MPNDCAASFCSNTSRKDKHKNIAFHTIPKNIEIQKEWFKFCKLKYDPNKSSLRVCSEHFLPTDYKNFLQVKTTGGREKYRPLLNENAIPSVSVNSIITRTTDRKKVLENEPINEKQSVDLVLEECSVNEKELIDFEQIDLPTYENENILLEKNKLIDELLEEKKNILLEFSAYKLSVEKQLKNMNNKIEELNKIINNGSLKSSQSEVNI